MSTSDDELRAMLARLDPMDGVPVEPVTSPQARHLLEQIMQSTHTEEPQSNVVPLRRRRGVLAAAASVAVLALGIGVGVANYTDDRSLLKGEFTRLALTAPGAAADPAMAMCLRFDAEALRTMAAAFAGTATKVSKETVTIDVDRWFKGGDADVVTIALPPGDVSPALLPGVEFTQGKRYAVTASDGVVNGCGFSGEATPDYVKTFDEAFGG